MATLRGRRSLRRHEARLRAVFQRLLVVSIAAPGLVACSSDDRDVSSDGGSPDATLAEAASGGRVDASGDSSLAGDNDGDIISDGPVADTGVDALADSAGGGDAEIDASDDSDARPDAGPPFPGCSTATNGAPYATDAGGPCAYFIDFSCARTDYAPVKGTCTPPAGVCLSICKPDAGNLFGCDYAAPACTLAGIWIAEAGAPVTLRCELCPGLGRRPTGLRKAPARTSQSALGAHFARASYLEAASVFAFERLEGELRAHGAPRALVRASRRAARDEVRHARVTARIARRHGGELASPRVKAEAPRPLEHMARENAVEGCVGETFGAMVAMWQAARALDSDVKRAMGRIAADETRHAALAWSVAAWAETMLGPPARKRVARARAAAVKKLERELVLLPRGEVAARAGLPTVAEARAIVRQMVAGVWALNR